jgi:hypothetical protein
MTPEQKHLTDLLELSIELGTKKREVEKYLEIISKRRAEINAILEKHDAAIYSKFEDVTPLFV